MLVARYDSYPPDSIHDALLPYLSNGGLVSFPLALFKLVLWPQEYLTSSPEFAVHAYRKHRPEISPSSAAFLLLGLPQAPRAG